MLRAFLIVLVLLAGIGGAMASPVVLWASDPIAPGETALVCGGGFGTTPKVEIKLLPEGPLGKPVSGPLGWSGGGQPVEVLQPRDNALKFVVPTGLKPGLMAYRITGPDGAVTGLLNRSAVWWVQGDAGLEATPGGWLRIMGKNLGSKGGPERTVVLQGLRETKLTATGDQHGLRAALPQDLPVGEYVVLVHGGYGGSMGWSEPVRVTVRQATAWPQQVFDVKKLGAVGDGVVDDTAAVQAALSAAEAGGGGVVYFPRGRYRLSAGLTVPRFTVLRGESEDLVNVLWADMPEPPAVMIKGTNSFGLQDLTLYCSNYRTFIAGDKAGAEAGDVFLRKVRVRANVFRGHMKPEEVDRRWREGLKVGFGGGYWLFDVGGRNLQITDCDLYSASCVYALRQPQGALVERNILGAGRWGGSGIFGGEGVILADNQYVGNDLMSWGAAGGIGYGNISHVYIARNSFVMEHGGDRESITSDASGGVYHGPIASAAGTTITLPEALKPPDKRALGMGVFVLDGRGRGQWRRATEYNGNRIEVDRPWDIVPDETSRITVVWLLRQWLIVDNSFSDVGISVQLYGSALEHIISGNTTARSAGYHNFGMNYHGIQPSWYIQWLGNEISEGNAYSAGHDNYLLSGEAHLGVFALPRDPKLTYPLTYGAIVRHNRLRNNAHIAIGGTDPYSPAFKEPVVQEVVVEGNEVANSQVGVFLRRAASGVYLRDNKYMNVVEPVRDEVEMAKAAEARRQKLLADPGPLAHWSFEEIKGTGVPDVTGHGFTATVTGKLTLEPGHRGQAGRFDGQTWLTVNEPDMTNLTNLTLSLWVKADSVKGRHPLLGKRFAGTAAPYVLTLWDGGVHFEACATDGKWSFNFRSPIAVKESEWHHVAAVVEQGKGVTLYVDGKAIATKDNAADRVMNNEPLIIGREAWAGVNMVHEGCFLKGLLDEVKIWGRALPAAEVLAEASK